MRLSVRLALLFIIIGIAPLLILGHFAYQRSQSALLHEAKSHLSSVAVLKEDALLEWIEGNIALLESVAARPLVREFALQISSTPRGTLGWEVAHEQLLESHLAPNVMSGIEALSVLHPKSGQILVSTDYILEGRFRESEEFFLRGKESTYRDHVRYNVAAESLTLHLSTPVVSSSGELLSVLTAHVDLEEMERIVQLTSGAHETQDIYLINESALFVTEPVFGQGFALRRMLNTEGAHAVLLGEAGVEEYANYRGVEVVGAYRWIEALSMGLLVETDRTEILQPIRALGVTMILGEIIASLGVLCLALLLAQQVVRPIRRLIEGTHQIGQGHLDHRIPVRGRDEIAHLGTSFNQMTENLQHVTASRDELDREVIARTRAEKRLRQQWEATKLILDGIHHVIYVTDPSTYEVLFVNEYFRDLLGTDPVGKLCYEAFQGFSAPCDFCTNGIILKEDKPHTWEYFNPMLERHFLITDRIISWSDRPQARLELAMDVTDRKKVENEMRRSKEITESTIESIPGIFYQISQEGRFVRWNETFTQVTGYSNEEMLEISPLDLFVGDDKQHIGEEIGHVFEHGSAEIAAKLVTKSGTRISYLFTGTLKMIENTPYLLGMGTDITALKQIEAQLRDSLKELERSNQELEQFAYVASHDLQEPLRMVSSYTQLLEKRYKDALDDDARDFIHYAVDGAVRMQHLINDLLAYSRVQTRGRPFHVTDLNGVLGRARANVQAAVEESDAVITNDELPTIPCDDQQMLSVFQNLLSNAIKFRGSDSPRIHVSAQEVDHQWQISVTDNGIGIDPQYHDRVFVIFQRLHARTEYPGTGIGLSLVKRIIERHGGKIRLDSQKEEGTTIIFTLPKYQQDKEPHDC